ncbi:MAG: ABC transporter permease [Candidatus Thermoplasmatota archaeon]|nr:ABC transporter permease [Candidatus Thermoplasmatota archaeon]
MTNITREVRGLSSVTLVSLGLLIFLFIVVLPLSSVFRFAFEDGIGPFINAVTKEEALNAFRNSLLVAFIATVINGIVGTLLALVITRYRFPGKQVFKALIDLPIAIPTAVVGLALMMLYGPQGLMGTLMQGSGIEVMMHMPGIVLAHVFVTFPYMVRSVSVVLEKLDPSLEEAAKTLGAGRFRTFKDVVLPSIRGGLVAGTALTFTRSLGEFGATLFVSGMMFMTGPLYIYHLSDSKFDPQGATSVAIVLMVFPFILLLSLNYLVSRLEVKE